MPKNTVEKEIVEFLRHNQMTFAEIMCHKISLIQIPNQL